MTFRSNPGVSRLYPGLALLIGVLSLVAACFIVSPKKPFWYDELTSYYLTRDSSPAHMLQAIARNVDTAPPFYHLLGWLWMRLFGESAFALRLFSSVGMCVAFVLVFQLLERVYQRWAALIASVLIFSISDLVLAQNAEARFYGLYMALCAAAVLLYQRLGEREIPSRRLLLLNALVHGALILTHYVGFLFSGAILLAFIIRDISQHRRSIAAYLSVLAGWCVFLLWLGSFVNQFSMVKQYTWIARPNLVLLGFIYLAGISLHIPFCLILFGISSRLLRRGGQSIPATPQKRSLQIVGGCLLVVPLLDWIVSQFATSVFLPRYLLPAAIGWAIVLANLAEPTILTLLDSKAAQAALTRFFAATIGLLLVFPIGYALRQPAETLPGSADLQYGDADLPIVTTSPHQFLPRFYYDAHVSMAQESRYYFVLDWEAALNPSSLGTAPTSYILMEAFKAAYPQVGQNILSLSDVLARYDRFLILDDEANVWPTLRLENNSGYEWQVIGTSDGIPLILVQKREVF